VSERLTALDATFLELEEADDSAHMHIGGIMVFEALPDGGAPSCRELCTHLEARLESLPRYAQRLSHPHTGGMHWPEWEPDPHFELASHVSRAALPPSGGDAELSEWASRFFSQRLDRRRPLWEMVIVEGLAGGRWALAHKTHHCMLDGVGAVEVGHVLLDAGATAAPEVRDPRPGDEVARPEASSVDPPAPSLSHGLLEGLSRRWANLFPLQAVRDATRLGAAGALHPRTAMRRARAAVALVVRDELNAAPQTSINVPIGTRRRFEVVRVPLADLKEIKSVLGGTINDVVLASSASALRALLLSRGETLPARGLRAMVPMNLRIARDQLALGNRISSLFIDLPLCGASPMQRYRETLAASAAAKSDGSQAAGTDAVIELAGLAPPVIHASLARALYGTRLFNLTVTNVPGPQQTLYVLGAPLLEIHPLVPLAAEHALGIAVLSYDGNVYFGAVADPDAVPDLDVVTSALKESVEDLLEFSRARSPLPAPAKREETASSRPPRTARHRAAASR
jgi:diacylglycerol O-acyltransferase / wax synthase